MVTGPVTIALLGAFTFIAIAVAAVAAWRARAARAALHASEAKHIQSVELLTRIAGHADSLIASLDPSGRSIQDAYEIRRVASTHIPRGLPGSAAMADANTVIKIEAAAAAVPASRETRLTAPVLVVEDEPGVRELIKRILMLAGREVVAVAGPHAALAVLRRQPAIALMLVDVVMPEMGGYDLAAEARTISPGVHVVFMSAFAQDTSRHPVRDGFLQKPFTTESLTGIVEEALRDR
jgi:CheY-like chemotaxis protein